MPKPIAPHNFPKFRADRQKSLCNGWLIATRASNPPALFSPTRRPVT